MQLTAQVREAQQAQVDAVIGIAGKTFSAVEQLVALNLRTARAALAGSNEAAHAALSARDMASLLQVQAGLVQPAAEKAAAYSREVYAIVTSTSAEFARVAESSATQAQQRLAAVLTAASKDVPVLTAGAVDLLKSSVEARRNAATTPLVEAAAVVEPAQPVAPAAVATPVVEPVEAALEAVVAEAVQAPLVTPAAVKAPVRTTPVANAVAGKGRNKR